MDLTVEAGTWVHFAFNDGVQFIFGIDAMANTAAVINIVTGTNSLAGFPAAEARNTQASDKPSVSMPPK